MTAPTPNSSRAPRAARVNRTTCHDRARTRLSEQPVLCVRAQVDKREATRFVTDALGEIRAFMHEHDLQPAGPPFSIATPAGSAGTVDVEAGWPIEHPAAGAGRIHGGTLPTALAGHSSGARPSGNGGRDPIDVF